MKKVGYLGPAGTFTEAAAYKYVGSDTVEMVCCSSLSEIVAKVENGQLDQGVVPLENSIEGSVNQILDLVAKSDNIMFCGEVLLNINHCLLVKPGTKKEQIKKVLSHPQALAQCRDYLNREIPWHTIEETASTAQAVCRAAGSCGDMAAIGTEMSAGIYGLEVMDYGIQDCGENVTRFIVLGLKDGETSANSKTSLVVEAMDRPGALYGILREFALKGINLTKIESRPVKKKLGQYLFFIDLEGHRNDPPVKSAIENLARKMHNIKILGSYPKDFSPAGHKQPSKEIQPVDIDEIRADIDLVDSQIVELIGLRSCMVRKMAPMKGDVAKIRDPARENEVINRVRELAIKNNADPETIEQIYKIIFNNSIKMQEKRLNSNGEK